MSGVLARWRRRWALASVSRAVASWNNIPPRWRGDYLLDDFQERAGRAFNAGATLDEVAAAAGLTVPAAVLGLTDAGVTP